MSVNHQHQADATLASFFTSTWPNDVRDDIDYSEDSDSGGSSEEWDGVSEPPLPQATDIDCGDRGDGKGDTDNEEGDTDSEESIGSTRYVHNLFSPPLVSHYRCGIKLTEDHLNMLQRHVTDLGNLTCSAG